MPLRKHLSPINNIVVDLPTPKNISNFWNLGSCLGLVLAIQIISGILLASRYTGEINIAYESVVYIIREVPGGWFVRNVHASGASIFFICIYIHIARRLFYRSYINSKTWYRGVTIYILSMATAFIGYLLPWGQISYWGATVITNLFSAIPYAGHRIVSWIWGGFAVGGATLSRFYAVHYVLPFIITGFVVIHLIFLHDQGSSNPLGVNRNGSKVCFHMSFTSKDVAGFILLLAIFRYFVFFAPHLLGDPENYIPGNSLVTPTHIKPEWYFLWVYAILRSVPSKLGGVLLLVRALLMLYILPNSRGRRGANTYTAPILIMVVVLLSWVGASPVEYPYEEIGSLLTLAYFSLILILI